MSFRGIKLLDNARSFVLTALSHHGTGPEGGARALPITGGGTGMINGEASTPFQHARERELTQFVSQLSNPSVHPLS